MSAELAQWAEDNHPGWRVFWGSYRQTFTAWATWTRESLSVEATDVHALGVAIRTEERAEEMRTGWPPPPSVLPPKESSAPPERRGPGVEQAHLGPHPLRGVRGEFLRGRGSHAHDEVSGVELAQDCKDPGLGVMLAARAT